MIRFFKISTLLFFLTFLVHEIVIISDGLIDDHNPKANVAVVLGSKVNIDGSLSMRLKARLDRGLKLYRDSLVSEIYVSGGLGYEGHYEGSVMAEYLISQGVPKGRVKIDNKGVNTRATAVNFAKDYPSESSAVVVSQYFHITRCKLAFRQVGIDNVKGVHCDFFERRDAHSVIREFVAFYNYLISY